MPYSRCVSSLGRWCQWGWISGYQWLNVFFNWFHLKTNKLNFSWWHQKFYQPKENHICCCIICFVRKSLYYIYMRHPSISGDDDDVLWMIFLSQHLSYLRLIQEWQSLPHFAQTKFDTGFSVISLWILLFLTIGQMSLQNWRGLSALPASRMIVQRLLLATCQGWSLESSGLFYRQLCSIVRICLQRTFLCQLAIQEIPGCVIVCTLRGCICWKYSPLGVRIVVLPRGVQDPLEVMHGESNELMFLFSTV